MEIRIHAVQFSADQKLELFIEEKVSKLDQFFDGIIHADVYLRLENTKDLENKLVEIKIGVPGNDLFAKKQAKSFEEATDLVVEALRRQVKKMKGKTLA
jgi:putative sigma-54 modulation protein